MEEMKSLFANVPKGKILLQQILLQDSARARLNLGDICSQCDYVNYTLYEPMTDKYHIGLQNLCY